MRKSKLEITKSMLMENAKEIIKILNQIKNKGIKIAIEEAQGYLFFKPLDTQTVKNLLAKGINE